MKITALKTWLVPPRWLFLKIETDAGVYGWGEPVIEGRAATVEAAVHELSDYIIGLDPHNIEHIWNMLYRSGFYRGGPILMSAIAGIDQALWDLKGRDYGVPVHQLLGGACRDKMQVYAWTGGDKPSDVGVGAKALVDQGFSALKMNGTAEMAIVDCHSKVDDAVARVAEARAAVGPNIGIGIDFHGRVHRPMAKILLREMEQFNPMFIEEPVLPEHRERVAVCPEEFVRVVRGCFYLVDARYRVVNRAQRNMFVLCVDTGKHLAILAAKLSLNSGPLVEHVSSGLEVAEEFMCIRQRIVATHAHEQVRCLSRQASQLVADITDKITIHCQQLIATSSAEREEHIFCFSLICCVFSEKN